MWLAALDLDAWQAAAAGWAAGLGRTGESILRIVLAGVLGGLIGVERDLRGHAAGFRTLMLVAGGAALVMVVSTALAAAEYEAVANAGVTVDPRRIAYGLMTGVGFLGAGSILQDRGGVRGLTTAAGIWTVAAVGLAAGQGLYVVAVAAAALLLMAIGLLHSVGQRLPAVKERRAFVAVPWPADVAGDFDALGDLARECGLRVLGSSLRRDGPAGRAEVRVKYLRRGPLERFLRAAAGRHGCEILRVERPGRRVTSCRTTTRKASPCAPDSESSRSCWASP